MLNIIIFGTPGAGKGTQSQLIIEKYGLHHISTGDILRQEIEKQSELGAMAAKYIHQGLLVPDAVILDMLAKEIDQNTSQKGYIFDGFPRNLEQAQALDNLLKGKELAVTATLNLSMEEAEIVKRLLKRGKESGRADDNLETIQKRITVYKEQTEPLIDFYKKQGKLFSINGSYPIEEVFESVSEIIDRLMNQT